MFDQKAFWTDQNCSKTIGGSGSTVHPDNEVGGLVGSMWTGEWIDSETDRQMFYFSYDGQKNSPTL